MNQLDFEKRSAKFLQSASCLSEEIDKKLHPAIAGQRPTRRRMGIAAGMREDAYELIKTQKILVYMANNNPTWGWGIKYVKDVKFVASLLKYSTWEELSDSKKESCMAIGLGPLNFGKAVTELLKFTGTTLLEKQHALEAEEKDLFFRKKGFMDFWPTPASLAEEMVALANLESGMRVLEPHAGLGNIALFAKLPGIALDCCEWDNEMRAYLMKRGLNVVGQDIFQHKPGPVYDRILMNPPFSRLADIKHVRYCYDNLLADGGMLISVMSTSWTFQTNSTAKQFRKFVKDCGWFVHKGRAFEHFGTGVNTTLVSLVK